MSILLSCLCYFSVVFLKFNLKHLNSARVEFSVFFKGVVVTLRPSALIALEILCACAKPFKLSRPYSDSGRQHLATFQIFVASGAKEASIDIAVVAGNCSTALCLPLPLFLWGYNDPRNMGEKALFENGSHVFLVEIVFYRITLNMRLR